MPILKRKYPPAYYRYRKKNPIISFVITKEFREMLDTLKGNLSYKEYLKKIIKDNIEPATQFKRKIEDRKLLMSVCGDCSKKFVIVDVTQSLIEDYLDIYRSLKDFGRKHKTYCYLCVSKHKNIDTLV